jgi:hypothetical protein
MGLDTGSRAAVEFDKGVEGQWGTTPSARQLCFDLSGGREWSFQMRFLVGLGALNPGKRGTDWSRAVSLCLIAFAGVTLLFLGPIAKAQEPAATITINTQQLGAQIPKDFLGFSNEVSDAGQGLPPVTPQALGGPTEVPGVPLNAQRVYILGKPDAPNTDFYEFMRNLGPGVLRLGGNSQDNTCWDLKAAPHPDWCQAAITADDLRLYESAARSAGWRIVLGLNLKQNAPKWALGEGTEGVSKEIRPSDLAGLEIGNEPDLFSRGPARLQTYSPRDYVREADAYIRAYQSDPRTRQYGFAGPAVCCGWLNPQSLDTILKGIGPSLNLVTVHNYPTTTCGDHNVTVQELLAPELRDRFNSLSEQLVAVARRHRLPIALAETNSASCGGMAGVSNAFASALWGLEDMFDVARYGYSSIEFHFSYRQGGSAYNPVQVFGWEGADKQRHYRNVAQPLYYAMYLFAQGASGEHLLPSAIETRTPIRTFATTACATCDVHIFLINEEPSGVARARVHLQPQAGKASLLLLRAPDLAALAPEVRYGGQQFDTDGHIAAPQSVPVSPTVDGDYTLTLPSPSIGLLTVTRRD